MHMLVIPAFCTFICNKYEFDSDPKVLEPGFFQNELMQLIGSRGGKLKLDPRNVL